MKWILVYIAITSNGIYLDWANADKEGQLMGMKTCFEERELLVEKIGRPIVNYQVVCIPTDLLAHKNF